MPVVDCGDSAVDVTSGGNDVVEDDVHLKGGAELLVDELEAGHGGSDVDVVERSALSAVVVVVDVDERAAGEHAPTRYCETCQHPAWQELM